MQKGTEAGMKLREKPVAIPIVRIYKKKYFELISLKRSLLSRRIYVSATSANGKILGVKVRIKNEGQRRNEIFLKE